MPLIDLLLGFISPLILPEYWCCHTLVKIHLHRNWAENVWAEFQHKENRPLSTVAFPLLSGWSTWPPRCTQKKHVTSHILKFRWNLKIMQLKRKILFHPPPFLGSKYEFFQGVSFEALQRSRYVLSRYIFMLLLDVLLLPQMVFKKYLGFTPHRAYQSPGFLFS